MIERLLQVAQSARTGHGAFYIKAIGLRGVEDGPETYFEHQQGMLNEETSQVGDVGFLLAHLDEQGFDIGTERMRTWSRPQTTGIALRKQVPLEEREKRSVALHHGIRYFACELFFCQISLSALAW